VRERHIEQVLGAGVVEGKEEAWNAKFLEVLCVLIDLILERFCLIRLRTINIRWFSRFTVLNEKVPTLELGRIPKICCPKIITLLYSSYIDDYNI